MSAAAVDPPEEVVVARAYLSRVAEPPAPALAWLAATVGPVEAADRVRRGAVAEEVARETAARRHVERAAEDLAAAAACGARILTPEHRAWPHWVFTALDNAAFGREGPEADLAPPLALWVRGPGDAAELCDQSAAVVGARAATGYGLHVAGEIGAGLAAAGFTVVSGAAIGIDGAAHRGALAAGGPSIAVLACGVDRSYPAAHEALLGRIAATGLVVSEYPPGSVPARHRFLVRNRLIAALGGGTVVVEAALRSGAQRTAADARALGRPVMAVPGAVTSGSSAGCHRLIREGAVLVTRVEEVLEEVGRIGVHLAEEPSGSSGSGVRPTDGLSPVATLVHDALPARSARGVPWLAMEAGLPQAAVRTALVELTNRGLVEHGLGRWQRTSAAHPDRP
ncbi:MAG: processing protein [Pseudonocardiales bacterium]|nr:processing protein [Pseudonocardiales bacterium]